MRIFHYRDFLLFLLHILLLFHWQYLPHYQYSIFKGPITPSKLILLKKELKKAINKEEDCVSIIKLQSEDSFDEEILGSQKEGNEDSLII